MPRPKNAMEIFQYLDKSNCQQCGRKTCLAFAGAVFTGQKRIEECPKLDASVIERFSDSTVDKGEIGDIREDYLDQLKERVAAIDLAEAAKRVGADFSGGKLTLKVLGRNFSVRSDGQLSTDIHINPWVAMPVLSYVLFCKGRPVMGEWRSFRELKEGRDRYPLFQKRCEEAMKQVADFYPDLFDDMVHLFSGEKVTPAFEADISVVLKPLPLVPMMICYWQPEDGLGSTINLFFDESADDNLDIGSLFTLGAGLAQMFERIAQRYGYGKAASS